MPKSSGAGNDIPSLPEGWKIEYWQGDYALVRIHKDDFERVRLLKLPKEVREYIRKGVAKHRQKLKELTNRR